MKYHIRQSSHYYLVTINGELFDTRIDKLPKNNLNIQYIQCQGTKK